MKFHPKKVAQKSRFFLLKHLIKRESKNEIHDYWRNPPDEGNKPEKYSMGEAALERSKALVMLIKNHKVKFEAKIFEIGCNIGRNLNQLYKDGFPNLYGLDVSEESINKMKEKYPEMSQNIHTYGMPLEEKIKQFENNEFGLVFTLATLGNIHRESEWVFSEIVRICDKLLITIENEHTETIRHFGRNYKKIFEPLGMLQIYERENFPGLNDKYIARVFQKRKN